MNEKSFTNDSDWCTKFTKRSNRDNFTMNLFSTVSIVTAFLELIHSATIEKFENKIIQSVKNDTFKIESFRKELMELPETVWTKMNELTSLISIIKNVKSNIQNENSYNELLDCFAEYALNLQNLALHELSEIKYKTFSLLYEETIYVPNDSILQQFNAWFNVQTPQMKELIMRKINGNKFDSWMKLLVKDFKINLNNDVIEMIFMRFKDIKTLELILERFESKKQIYDKIPSHLSFIKRKEFYSQIELVLKFLTFLKREYWKKFIETLKDKERKNVLLNILQKDILKAKYFLTKHYEWINSYLKDSEIINSLPVEDGIELSLNLKAFLYIKDGKNLIPEDKTKWNHNSNILESFLTQVNFDSCEKLQRALYFESKFLDYDSLKYVNKLIDILYKQEKFDNLFKDSCIIKLGHSIAKIMNVKIARDFLFKNKTPLLKKTLNKQDYKYLKKLYFNDLSYKKRLYKEVKDLIGN